LPNEPLRSVSSWLTTKKKNDAVLGVNTTEKTAEEDEVQQNNKRVKLNGYDDIDYIHMKGCCRQLKF
jgi:hypothetical protein